MTNWILSNGVEVSAWASGNNHAARKTYLWAIVGLNDDYITLEMIEYQIVQPNVFGDNRTGTFTTWQPLTTNQVEENGDPNFGTTFIPENKGCHKVTIKLKLQRIGDPFVQFSIILRFDLILRGSKPHSFVLEVPLNAGK
ncbi:hypothetical protein H6F76_03525 [Leptolyngbya sp. FACHB-321]|uniref:hypothetical protein n=1 Tax=Leptolyngbya sp. FACHB-321 TaxID=2692807 RepID=UPI001684E75B|nr:hypothetical protein [Leptolyngbya sp. FACHB-321]MBD2034119.1 hypothetical protein [Leptolyngbya sp. FACHB-321]